MFSFVSSVSTPMWMSGYDDYSSDYTPGYIVKSEAKHDADNFEIKQEIDDGGNIYVCIILRINKSV